VWWGAQVTFHKPFYRLKVLLNSDIVWAEIQSKTVAHRLLLKLAIDIYSFPTVNLCVRSGAEWGKAQH